MLLVVLQGLRQLGQRVQRAGGNRYRIWFSGIGHITFHGEHADVAPAGPVQSRQKGLLQVVVHELFLGFVLEVVGSEFVKIALSGCF